MKKAFFDGWDNLIGLIIFNLGFVASLAAGYGAFAMIQISPPLGIVLLVLFYGLLNIFIGGVSAAVKEYAFYQRPDFRDFLGSMKAGWKVSLVHALYILILLIMIFIVIPFYAGFEGILSAVVIALLFWVALFSVMASMYYFPLALQLNNSPGKALKKSFLLVFDNLGVSIFLLFYTLINTLLSLVTAFLIPGFAAVLMSHHDAVKLLLLKYDYLEANRDVSRRKIPWSALLIDEREKVGHRSIRGMIFPWKE